jgi:CheY-like chemotaxis protein
MIKQHYVIVVADDDPATNALLQVVLSSEGYEVLCCFTGAEAERVIQRVIPDVAIVDMQMEVRDAGLHLLKTVRANPRTANLAVILCSADELFLIDHRDDIAACRATIMTKPFELEHLLATVEQALVTAVV